MLTPDHGRTAERDRAAQDRAEVLRILNAVEGHREQGRILEELGEGDECELRCPSEGALVHAAFGQSIELSARRSLDSEIIRDRFGLNRTMRMPPAPRSRSALAKSSSDSQASARLS